MAEPAVVLSDEREKVRRWQKLIKLCEDMKFGEINLKIQNGVPQVAEKIICRVKFD